jgi:2-amino-4-hydroxy-6-hydroxymethyldihydropteridine diphosphokinase
MAGEPERRVRVYLGLGSNINPEENLRLGIRELRWRFGPLDLSPVYRSRPLGFAGEDFLNMVIGLDTTEQVGALRELIDGIHDLAGRERGSGRFISRPLDIDLLLYGDTVVDAPGYRVPRPDILRYSFVLKPLSDLAPGLCHPETGRTMREHWQDFDAGSHPLTPVPLVF